MAMDYEKVAGVKISPSLIEFYDAEPNVVHQMKISVQNLDKISKHVKFLPPTTKNFCIHSKETEKFLAPGLELVAYIEYFNDKDEDCEDHIVFKVGDHFVEVPLLAYAPKSILTVNRVCNLGTIVADGQVYIKDIAILNHGVKHGDFKIFVEPDLPFLIMPIEGTIQPGYSQPIRFEFVSKTVGEVDVKLRVLLDNVVTDYVQFKANVVQRSLHLQLKDKGQPVDCIQFGCTYYGSDIVKSYTLYNESPIPVSFVAVLEEDGPGEEKAVDSTKSFVKLCTSPNDDKDRSDNSILIDMVPSEATLRPFEEREVFFKFSPRFIRPSKGWGKEEKLPPRRDYAMFLHINAVGAVNDKNEDLNLELALTGTALPIALSIFPSTSINFEDCILGDKQTGVLQIRNDSADVPLCFAVRKIAHFHSSPSCGYISPDDIVDLMLSFQPNQNGTFKCDLLLDIVGQVCVISKNKRPVYKKVVLQTRRLPVSGHCPLHSNAASNNMKSSESNVEHATQSLQLFTSKETTALMEKSSMNLSKIKSSEEFVRIAQPNERACSIRPSDSDDLVRTRFTKQDRYTYIDPDYTYPEDIKEAQEKHKQKYVSYLQNRASQRKTNKLSRTFKKLDNEIDLGMKPAHGLRPPKLKLDEMKKEIEKTNQEEREKQQRKSKLLSSKTISSNRINSSKKRVVDGLKAVPTTATEKKDCNQRLSPQELYQINLESELVDFGDVCKKSISSKILKISNNLPKNVLLSFDVTNRELRQTSPLSQVIPPQSVAQMEFIFESPREGKFEKSINYTINSHHKNHILMHANVVNVHLELSTIDILITPHHGTPAEAGFRKTVDLINTRNMAAEFSWTPVLSSEGTSFTIRPAKGVVEAHSRLTLEVAFYPSYSAICTGKFVANVEGGNELTLNCTAEMGYASCTFVERRLMFGSLPLHLVTARSAFLKNTSNNHAFFKVSNHSPIEGMIINPRHGVVPIGGTTELQVLYRPEVSQKFDTTIQVDILGWKTISLRMGGHVEHPLVDLDVSSFNFGGIYTGAKASAPFKIKNLARSNVLVVFNLVSYKDFKVVFPEDQERLTVEHNGLYHINVSGLQTIHAVLLFNPTEVAAYDFILPVSINHILAPTPAPSPYPTSVVTSKPETYKFEIPTARRRVRATALRTPLTLSVESVEFQLPASYFDLKIEDLSGRMKTVRFTNNSGGQLSWCLDVDGECGDLFERGVFAFIFYRSSTTCLRSLEENRETVVLENGESYELKVIFQPEEGRKYEANVPIILNGNRDQPYSHLHLSGEMFTPSLKCQPEVARFKPVPLGTTSTVDVVLAYKDFSEDTELAIKIPKIELEDGSKVEVISVKFNERKTVRRSVSVPCSEDANKITCTLSFVSTRPVCFSTNIEFIAGDTSIKLPISGTADNCILTTYNFLANSSSDFHIVCERFKERLDASTETVFVPCVSPIRAPTGVSMTNSTAFSLHSSSYEDSSLVSSPTPEEGEESTDVNIESDTYLPYEYSEDIFPLSDTEEGKILKEILKTVQRWYSSQAWSHGPSPISVPTSLRCCLTTENDNGTSTSRSGSWNRDNTTRKGKGNNTCNKKNIVVLISHLCGKQVPGIPTNTSLPVEKKERLNTILWIYSTLLTFLKCQGGMVATIEPEYLLDIADHHFYCNAMAGRSSDKILTSSAGSGFEMKSRKAWCDLLLQVVKVFVLAKITPASYKKIPLPPGYPPLPTFNPDPCCSNVYNISERILLAWLNHHYEQQRSKCWKQNKSGVKPPSRWIVNFENDFVDGLVLASLLCAYAPYLISTELSDLYTQPNSAEQCLHNTLKVVNTLKKLGLDYDIMATDITEPNSVSILLLCVYLYQRLPFYLPTKMVEFTGILFATVTKQVKLQNPSSKPILYHAVMAGKYANDFTIPQGEQIQVPPKGTVEVSVEFKSRFLRVCECTLVLVGKRTGSAAGSTLTFTLKGIVQTIQPLKTIRYKSPCYELKKIQLSVKNPFPIEGSFKMVLVEADPSSQLSDASLLSLSKKNQKSVASRTDHGQRKKIKNTQKENLDMLKDLVLEDKTPMLSAFWSPDDCVKLTPYGTADIEVQFLPFDLGTRQCSVLFLNEEIGEFLYSIETESLLPLPTEVPFFYDDLDGDRNKHGSRVTSAMAMHHSQGILQEDNSIIYLHCDAEKESMEELNLPVHNYTRGKALLIATEQRMSEKEIRRREKTGVTSAETILAAVSCLQVNRKAEYKHPSELLGITGTILEFNVELSSPYFTCQSSISVPVDGMSNSMEETVKLPITVLPCEPGQYSCLVILKSANDIRVYRIECTIKHSNSEIEIEFTSPAHQSVVQGVPVVNHSDLDWNLSAIIDGEGFTGPSFFTAYAHTTTSFPLCFQPVYEGLVQGSFVLKNKSNGAENRYFLKGLATKPLPVDEIHIDCIVNEQTMKVLEVTNKMPYKMVFQAFSDMDMINGPPFITVLPQQTVAVPFNILTRKRGMYQGVISFVYDADFVKEMGLDKPNDEDSDDEGEQNNDTSNTDVRPFLFMDSSQCLADLKQSRHFQRPYHLWYSIHINSIPNEPVKCLDVSSAVNSTSTVELLLKNPKKEDLNLDIIIDGLYLYGQASVTVKPFSSAVYQLHFSPIVTGKTKASVIFQSDCCTEFWYDVLLTAENPMPKQLPMMQCTLGKSCEQGIPLSNPSVQPITYDISCSNPDNFQIDGTDDMKVTVPALSDVKVTLTFVPSCLGSHDHKAEIVFYNNDQGSCFTFHVMGVADKPLMPDKHQVQAEIGANASLIILFQNPFLHDILVDVELKELQHSKDDDREEDDHVFGLLLKNFKNIILPAKSTLDIPVSYAPDRMRKEEAVCTVYTRSVNEDSRNNVLNNPYVNWVYEIDGIPVCIPVKVSNAPVVQCRARERVDEKLEIVFTGADGELNRTNYNVLKTSFSPIHLLGQYNPSSGNNPDYEDIPGNFDYFLDSADPEVEDEIQRFVAIQLKRQSRHNVSGLISLLFEVVFASSKMFDHLVYFVITSSSGGVWKYPIRFVSTEPISDDVITIKSVGLNKESKVSFRLFSQANEPVLFEAYFANGYDDMFTVRASSDLLLPSKDGGTLFTVAYKPTFYGKTHRTKLMIQTRELQWIYDIRGETPEYAPPRTNAAIESHLSSAHQQRPRKKNYVRENLKIHSTAVSSPLKGAPVLSTKMSF